MSTWLTNSLQRAGELLESVDQKAAVKLKPVGDERARKALRDKGEVKRVNEADGRGEGRNREWSPSHRTNSHANLQATEDNSEIDAYSEWSEVDNESNSGIMIEDMPLSSSSSRSLAPLQSPPSQDTHALRSENTRLRKENSRLKSDVGALERKLATTQERLTVCEEELEGLDKECMTKIKSLENEIAQLKHEKANDEQSFQTALAMKDAHVQSIQAEFSQKTVAMSTQLTELEMLRQQLNEIKNNKDLAWTSAASGEARVHEQLLSVQLELKESQALVATLKKENADIKQSMYSRQCQLEAVNAELTQSVAALERQLHEKSSNTTTTTSSTSTTYIELQRTIQELSMTKKQLHEESRKGTILVQEIEKFRHELTTLQGMLLEKDKKHGEELYTLRAQLNEAQAALKAVPTPSRRSSYDDDNDSSHKSHMQAMTHRLLEKQEQLDSLRSRYASLEVRFNALNARMLQSQKIDDLEMNRPKRSLPLYQHHRNHRVLNAVDAIDRQLFIIGRFLRAYPAARLAFVFYLMLLHLWIWEKFDYVTGLIVWVAMQDNMSNTSSEGAELVWLRRCLPIFVQPKVDLDNDNHLLRVLYNFERNGTTGSLICRLCIIFAGESSYNRANEVKHNGVATLFYRSFNRHAYERTADINYMEFRGVNLSENAPRPWLSIYTGDHSGNQTWAQGDKRNICNWFSLMYHYEMDIPFSDWVCEAMRPRIYLNTCNHMIGEVDNNPSLPKYDWSNYPFQLGDAADALYFVKDNVPTKFNLYSLCCFCWARNGGGVCDRHVHSYDQPKPSPSCADMYVLRNGATPIDMPVPKALRVTSDLTMEFLRQLSAYLGGPGEVEETEEQRFQRERRQAKLRMLSRSQRGVILDDLKASVMEVLQLLAENQKQIYQAQTSATMESVDDNNKKALILNDEIPAVSKLCANLDRCFSHGLRRVENDDQQSVKFFGLLKWTCTRLSAIHQQRMACGVDNAGSANFSKQAVQLATSSLEPELPRNVRGFVACVRTANNLSNVQQDEGKVRAFIRQALNTHILLDCMKVTLSDANDDLLVSYFTEYALFRQKEEIEVFLSLLEGLDTLSFGFMVNDVRLDLSPDIQPFSTPLPKPVPQIAEAPPAELIDPEDMIQGRVRLSGEDYECNLLASKLMSYHQLNAKFDTSNNGNPLSEVLKKAKTSQALDDATTAVLRFLEIGLPEYDVFGASLIDVVCNPFLCGLARFDTSLGLPDVVEACVCYLHRKLATPGLFQVHLASEHVLDLRDAIEELGGFHKSMAIDPHEVISVLLQYLWELPEPLLTEGKVDAFIAAAKSSVDEKTQITTLRSLVNDLPWYTKPLLERLLHLWARVFTPEYQQKNGLEIHMLGVLLSPILLRPNRSFRFSELDEPSFRRFPLAGHIPIKHRFPPNLYSEYPSEEAERIASEVQALRKLKQQAEEGAHVVELLIMHQEYILKDVRDDMARHRQSLEIKVAYMEKVRHRLAERIDVSKPYHVSLLKKLWDGLLPLDESASDYNSNLALEKVTENVEVTALLNSSRWLASGFHTKDPLGGFRGGGLLSLECLAYFVHEYKEKAQSMMARNAVPGGSRYPFPVAAINVMRMMIKLLMLDQVPATSSKLILHSESGVDTILQMQVAERVSRTPFWKVFDEENAF
ncbi:hypothetical protein THRCLA_07187, partial [Thraustotheca clavata]